MSTNAAALKTHNAHAEVTEICPEGKCRVAVRGFRASKWRSTMRLNAIAQVRAAAITKSGVAVGVGDGVAVGVAVADGVLVALAEAEADRDAEAATDADAEAAAAASLRPPA